MATYQFGTITGKRHLGDSLVVLTIQPEQLFNWQAGQFIVTKNLIESIEQTADYTIISSPSNMETFDILVENYEGSVVGKWLHSLAEGSKMQFKGAKGRFVLPENLSDTLVFIFREIGIAPFLAFLHVLKETKYDGKVYMFAFNGKKFENLFPKYFSSNFGELDIQYKEFGLNEENNEGKLPSKEIKALFNDLNEVPVFIAGMSEFVKNLRTRLIRTGFKKDSIYREVFGWKRTHPKRS